MDRLYINKDRHKLNTPFNHNAKSYNYVQIFEQTEEGKIEPRKKTKYQFQCNINGINIQCLPSKTEDVSATIKKIK